MSKLPSHFKCLYSEIEHKFTEITERVSLWEGIDLVIEVWDDPPPTPALEEWNKVFILVTTYELSKKVKF